MVTKNRKNAAGIKFFVDDVNARGKKIYNLENITTKNLKIFKDNSESKNIVSDGEIAFNIEDMADVELTTPVDGQVLKRENGRWINGDTPGYDGQANTASNVGVGSGIFKQKTNEDLEFKKIKAGSHISLTDNLLDIEISADNVCAGDDSRLNNKRDPNPHTHTDANTGGLITHSMIPDDELPKHRVIDDNDIDAVKLWSSSKITSFISQRFANLDWQESVLNFYDPSVSLPTTPVLGDRYITSQSGNGWIENNIYEWNGTSWDETAVDEGTVSVVEYEDKPYKYTEGSGWEEFININASVGPIVETKNVDVDALNDYKVPAGIEDWGTTGNPLNWNISRSDLGDATAYITIVDYDNHLNTVKIDDVDISYSLALSKDINQTSGRIEFHLLFSDVQKPFYIKLLNNTIDAVYLTIENGILKYKNSSDQDIEICSVVSNEWTHFGLEFNCNGGVGSKFNIGVGGGGLIEYEFNNDQPTITKFEFHTSTGQNNYQIYVDAVGFSWNSYKNYSNFADGMVVGKGVHAPVGIFDELVGFEPEIITKNTAFNKNFGNEAETVCEGNDSRLSDDRVPTTHDNSKHSTNYEPEITTKNTAFNKNFGSITGSVCQGDDSRLSDARTPTSHSHNLNDLVEKSYNSLTDNPAIPANLNDLGDVNALTPADAEVLTWDQTQGEWQAKPAEAGGTDDQTASEVPATITNFDGLLSSADDDVQKALDTLDDHSHAPDHSHSNKTELDAITAAGCGSIISSVERTKLDGIADNANNYSHPNHSGEVSSTGDGATVIANDVVTNAKLANMAALSIKGNNTGLSANPLDLSKSQVKTLLGFLENMEDDSTPQLGGDLDCNQHSIELDPTPTTNATAQGTIIKVTYGESISFQNALYLASDGKYYKAKGDVATTTPCIALAIDSGIANDTNKKVLLFGIIRNDTDNWTGGSCIYLDEATSGNIKDTVPAGSGNQVQRLGIALSADVIYFNPSFDVIEIN